MITTNEQNQKVYQGDSFKITLRRYSDPERLNLAYSAAKYLGKDDIKNIRRPLRIIQSGHVPAIMRGEMAEFVFEDVSKDAYDHLTVYTTMNMRVTGGNRALKSDGFTMPSDRMKNPELVESAIEGSFGNYTRLLEAGETPQVARSAMPVNTKMNTFILQFNFVTLGESIFKQRIWEKGAAGNTAKVVQGMYELVNSIDSDLWDTVYEWWGEPATSWVEVRRKIKKRKITVGDFLKECEKHIGEGKSSSYNTLEAFLTAMYGEQKSMWD